MPRLAITVQGIVQGVGFRPFVYAQARALGLSGWVRNGADGVHVEVEGNTGQLDDFLAALGTPPPAARIERVTTREVPTRGEEEGAAAFVIARSTTGAAIRPILPADRAICPDCVREIETASERRSQYAFTNCTQCGPRYSIIEALPYDRPRTSMRVFPMCEACAREYGDPADRRFHAQPIACPACGPTLSWAVPGASVDPAADDDPLTAAADALRAGLIVALKGLGGFQLLCDATNEEAVARLRARKHREEKPLAVMVPSLEAARAICEVSLEEAEALSSPAAPIVLLRRLAGAAATVASPVAPGNPQLGVMLPYSPLHRLLLSRVARPVVCTSGNLSEEPMCTHEHEALERLGTIADAFLIHDRGIVRPVDDSVVRVGSRGMEVLRRARGFAPLPLGLPGDACVIATGAQLKNTVALAVGGQVVVSQHLGDLSTTDGALLCARTVDDLVSFFRAEPAVVACDLHPDYASSRLGEVLSRRWGASLVRVQHHHAHVAACVAEHRLQEPVLGLAWDGSGLGIDDVVWGGEALVVDGARFERLGHLRSFPLPGGERAAREPWRSAAGLLHELFGAGFLEHVRIDRPDGCVLARMLERRVNCPRTTSIGRLFDAVAALTGLCVRATFEGQAAMALEHAADGIADAGSYRLPLSRGEPAVADWEPLVLAVLHDVRRGLDVRVIAARLHAALVDLAEAMAHHAGLPRVVLSGGCFQNLRLATTVRQRLEACGFTVYTPRLYPPNDGGISLGQAFVARQGPG